ncbi:MAG: GEVED domain-containing protein, partial [Bacteroidales bacterium]|nr:GEVED domain-containing protein [Bacteroidales bacterium]
NNNQSKEDFDSWLVFGDPSLMLRTKTPQEMTVTHNPVMFLGMSEFSVICDAENALATMSWVVDDEVIILGTGVVSGGVANITLKAPVAMPGEITLCVTGHNRVTKLSTILATPAEGPYVVASGYSVVGEDKLTYISTNTEIEVTLSNVGIEGTDNLTVTLSCDDPQITIVEDTATTTGIAADGTAIVKFKVTVSNDIPDNKNFLADVTIAETGKGNTWDGKLSLKAFAPDFTLEKVLVDGVENGSIGAGTVATITTVVKNKGGADAYKVKGDLDISSPFITFACEDISMPGQLLPAGETIEIPFVVVTDADMPYGHQAEIDLLINAQYGRSGIEPFTVSNAGADGYCVPSYSIGCTSNDKFTQVILYKTSEPSNLLINKLDGACSPGAYEDYTNITIPLEPGQQYTIKLKCGFSSQTARGWFDLNGNNVFDTNEQLFSLSCSSSGVEYTANFTIPTEFTPGTSRF